MSSERTKYENLIRQSSNYSFIEEELKKNRFQIPKGCESKNKSVELKA